MTKNRTPTPVYLDPGMHSGLEVKGLITLCFSVAKCPGAVFGDFLDKAMLSKLLLQDGAWDNSRFVTSKVHILKNVTYTEKCHVYRPTERVVLNELKVKLSVKSIQRDLRSHHPKCQSH